MPQKLRPPIPRATTSSSPLPATTSNHPHRLPVTTSNNLPRLLLATTSSPRLPRCTRPNLLPTTSPPTSPADHLQQSKRAATRSVPRPAFFYPGTMNLQVFDF